MFRLRIQQVIISQHYEGLMLDNSLSRRLKSSFKKVKDSKPRSNLMDYQTFRGNVKLVTCWEKTFRSFELKHIS